MFVSHKLKEIFGVFVVFPIDVFLTNMSYGATVGAGAANKT